ncbi:MAG TPA: M3 family peptidase, partial [Candidatus Aminicenantes bacterium]|nr:M3 family peptidase [Candidatus Aminicenantes bacterium]
VKRANLLGYKTHADYVLENNMAKKPENVYKFLEQLWKPALKMAKGEVKELQEMISKEGHDFKLQPWDWWYYAEKLKKAKYALDEEMLRPYFKLENVREGAFSVANKLFGIQFIERKDIPKYHEDARVFEVKEADGSHIGIFYTDFFPRASKRGGAWMNSFRKQSRLHGKEIYPVITNNGNFSKPTGGKPALISSEEVLTLFHEFGHGLHGLLSDCTYNRLSGTSVSRDFVEMQSQIMENWAFEPEVLKMYAKHYETGEVIPQELIDKLEKASQFNQGFVTVEYMAACFLDMDWHTLSEAKEMDVDEFEEASMNKIGLIPEIVVRYKSPYFNHIFSGGYASGYYSYIWAEVLDADAFQAFKETSLFDQKTAQSFRENILERGGTEDPMVLYKRFRGAEPKVEALLKKRGLN